jgi:hypothetical protein
MKIKKELDIASNKSLYNKLYKTYVCRKHGLCDRGSWKHFCNRRKLDTSWKRKRKRQYRVKIPQA